MQLTPAQLATLKAWVETNNNSLFDESAVALLNSPASPVYKAWRSTLDKHDVIDLADVDEVGGITNFVGGGSTGSYIDRSVAEKAGWVELWNSVLACQPFRANIRVMLFDIFSGTNASSVMNRKHFWARAQRPVTVFEKLFTVATVGGPAHFHGNGNTPTGQTGDRGSWTNPDTFGSDAAGRLIEGPVTLQDVVDAANA